MLGIEPGQDLESSRYQIPPKDARERLLEIKKPVIQSLHVARSYPESKGSINAIDFTNDGTRLISTCNNLIRIYDCVTGSYGCTMKSHKSGADLIQFTHVPDTALHTSLVADHDIRHFSVETCCYIGHFKGHGDRITTLRASATTNLFISTSFDRTLRLWDLRTPLSCQGVMTTNGLPVADFDPPTVSFAVGVISRFIKLYDVRMFEKGPFSEFDIRKKDKRVEWAALKFSPDGKKILISTYSSQILLVDAFTGKLLRKFNDYHTEGNTTLEASFSPDGQFVFSGSSDSVLHVWDAEKGDKLVELRAKKDSGPVKNVKFNPRAMMLASTCVGRINLWTPTRAV